MIIPETIYLKCEDTMFIRLDVNQRSIICVVIGNGNGAISSSEDQIIWKEFLSTLEPSNKSEFQRAFKRATTLIESKL